MGPNSMQGYWKYYYENGVIEAEKNYKDGKEHGVCKWYLVTGELRTFEVWDEGIRTDCKIYYKSGMLEERFSYYNGIPSNIQLFHENGKKKLESCITLDSAGFIIKQGLTKWYGEDEELLVIENYEKNVKEGLTKFYYRNGNLQALVNFKNGNPDRVVKEYNEDGTLKS
jgi:antitoxin component YwqK of YwqJK toxin-antitoxin module